MIPATTNLAELQDAFRDLYAKLNSLLVGDIDLKSRRLTRMAPAIAQFDAVTKFDLKNAINELEANITAANRTIGGSTALAANAGVRFGLFAAQGAATAHTNELFIATDTFQRFHSDGATWTELISPTLWPMAALTAAHGAIKDGTIAGLGVVQMRNGADNAYVDAIVLDEVYGSGWNGNAAVPTKNAVYDKIESLPSATTAAGTYTPTRSAETNLDANVTMSEAQYLRVGATVLVSGRFTANPALAATATSFEGTLPVASNIGAVEDIAGTAFCGNIAGQGAEIIGVVANDTFKVQWVSGDITNQTWSYAFAYQVI